MRPDRRHQRGDMQRARAGAGDLDVIDVRLVADLELEHRVHLVLARGRAEMAFDEHRARPLLDDGERTGEYRSGLAAGMDDDEMDRLHQRRALRYADDGAGAHAGGA